MRRIMLAALALTMGSAGADAADITVRMVNHAYEPALIKARTGDTLVFVNEDGSNHAVFVATRGFAFDLGTQKPGEERRYQLKQAGRFEVECVPHAHMKLVVEVAP